MTWLQAFSSAIRRTSVQYFTRFQLRQLSFLLQFQQLRPTCSLATDAAITLVQAFVSRRLDYCNSLLYGVWDSVPRKCRLTSHHWSSTIRSYHASATSAALASCPTTSRVQGRMSDAPVTVCQAPAYLANDTNLASDSQWLPPAPISFC